MHTNPPIAARRSRRCSEKLNSVKISIDPTNMPRPRSAIEASITTHRGEQKLEGGVGQAVLPRSLIALETKLYCGRKTQATDT